MSAENLEGPLLKSPYVAGGVCIVCGSELVLWCGHPDKWRIHCNDCGSEVTEWMHKKKQPIEKK